MPNYTKLFNSIVTSTIWTEDDKTRIVWITMLALADQNGEVHSSVPGLARLAGVATDDAEAALAKFLAPDRYSRTPDHEGRRIAAIDGGWELLNHGKYRRMASVADAKDTNAERQRRHRERARQNAGNPVTHRNGDVTPRNGDVTPRNGDVTPQAYIAEAEAEADVLLEKEPKGRAAARPGRDDEDFKLACLIDLDPLAQKMLRDAWQEWQGYRQDRHKAKGGQRIPWTSRAARLSANDVCRASEQHGTQMVVDRIHTAIAGNWQGLNFDTLNGSKTNGHRQPAALSRMENIEIHSVEL